MKAVFIGQTFIDRPYNQVTYILKPDAKEEFDLIQNFKSEVTVPEDAVLEFQPARILVKKYQN